MQSNSWLAVIGDGKLKDYKLEKRNIERELVRSCLWWHITWLKTGKKGTLTERWLGVIVGGKLHISNYRLD